MRQKKDLVQIAVAEIEEWIKSGKYLDMDLLPSEGDISEMMEVSRSTVRDAIRVLEVRGFVERIHGVGVRVNDRSMEVAISFLADMMDRNDITSKEVLEIRRVIEPKAAILAAEFATEKDLLILKECVDVMEEEKNISEAHHESDYTFHETLAKASGNRLLYTIVKAYRPLLYNQIGDSDNKGTSLEAQHHFHRNILDCIENHDTAGAKAQMLIHLDDTERNLLG